jgi:hypothetical protein
MLIYIIYHNSIYIGIAWYPQVCERKLGRNVQQFPAENVNSEAAFKLEIFEQQKWIQRSRDTMKSEHP